MKVMSQTAAGSRKIPTSEGVARAAARLLGVVTETPLLPIAGYAGSVWLKPESLQPMGAFKLRGAYNRCVQIPRSDRSRGVVAFSSGNHAQGVAMAARILGMPALIVMPEDAPRVKLDGTAALGAEIVTCDRAKGVRERIAAEIAAERGAVLIPSFDDIDVIEGQGSVGIEIERQLGHPPARVIVPCGGGGLAGGIALALPDTEIVVVEPEGWDDMRRSLEAGDIVEVPADAGRSECDALLTRRVSDLTFRALRETGAHGCSVSQAEHRAAMRFAFDMGLVLEPGGAVALAAWLAGRVADDGQETVIVASGGNVDPKLFAEVLGERT